MGRCTTSKGANIPNKHLHARISYLYQAATYLAIVEVEKSSIVSDHDKARQIEKGQDKMSSGDLNSEVLPRNHTSSRSVEEAVCQNFRQKSDVSDNIAFSRYLSSHLHGISLKGQICLSSKIKHSICRKCQSILVPGRSSTATIENLSRGGKKPWADVLVVECNACNSKKRFPIGLERQPCRNKRKSNVQDLPSGHRVDAVDIPES